MEAVSNCVIGGALLYTNYKDKKKCVRKSDGTRNDPHTPGTRDTHSSNSQINSHNVQRPLASRSTGQVVTAQRIVDASVTVLNRLTVADPIISSSYEQAAQLLRTCMGVLVLASIPLTGNGGSGGGGGGEADVEVYGLLLARQPPSGTNKDDMWSWPVIMRINQGCFGDSGSHIVHRALRKQLWSFIQSLL